MRTMIVIPTYDGKMHSGLLHSTRTCAKEQPYAIGTSGSSFLTRCFNVLWAGCLNARDKGFTHFCMLHADVVPDGQWLDKMHEIMAAKEADILSVVMPIKSQEGVTSTALDVRDHWQVQRLTMHEIFKLDPTFTHEKILINTGLMLVDIRKPWVENVFFRTEDLMEKVDGKFKVRAMSEDWAFSRDARAAGAKIFATREVLAIHHGNASFPNSFEWGTLTTDHPARPPE